MKKILSMLAIASVATTFISCDEDPVSAPPSIQVVSAALEQRAGESVDVNVSIIADAGIKTISVTVEGGTSEDITGSFSNQKAAVATYSFQVPDEASEGETFEIYFTVTDNRDRTSTTPSPATVTVDDEPSQVIEISESPNGVGTTTWLARNTYVLNGKIYVNDGQTLTIEAGTVIKGQTGQAESASALIVARGGKIIANGTAENPIIFTALADDVSRADDLPMNQRGLWGGVLLLGNAFINHANGQTNIEGIVATDSDARSLYGVGTDPVSGKNWPEDNAHSAGELSYVSIRHGGTNIGAGNEINGLTFGGVGSGTKVHHIEVFANDDDGFEWFGGTVNTSYLASILNQDDAFDWDFGWRAENQFWVAVQEQGFDDSNRGFESDGAHSGNLNVSLFSKPRVYNMTLVGSAAAGSANDDDHNAMFFTENSGGMIHNSIIMGFGEGVNLTTVGGSNGNSRDRLASGDIAFKNNIWSQVANNTSSGIANGYVPLQAYLEDETNGNEISDAPGISITERKFTLVPDQGSLALTKPRSTLPENANQFTYEAADFIGAFGSANWLKGWTAVDAYGLLP